MSGNGKSRKIPAPKFTAPADHQARGPTPTGPDYVSKAELAHRCRVLEDAVQKLEARFNFTLGLLKVATARLNRRFVLSQSEFAAMARDEVNFTNEEEDGVKKMTVELRAPEGGGAIATSARVPSPAEAAELARAAEVKRRGGG